MTRIGKRSTRVELEYPSTGVRNTVGHKEKVWLAHGGAWVAMKRLSGGEVEVNGQVEVFGTYEVRMLFVDAPDLTTQWRLRRGTSEPFEYFAILSADQNEFDRKEWVLVVSRDERNQVGEEIISP